MSNPAPRGDIGRGRARRLATALVLGVSALGLASCFSPHHSGLSENGKGRVEEIGVNAYLWRATLDTLAFMPLKSADPYGGVVITDWYVNPQAPNERFKTVVYILDTRLRADGLSVSVFRQVSNGAGGWTDAPTADKTSEEIENAILTRARQLRLSDIKG